MPTEFLVSLLFGGGIIVFFAWDQFKRPSYEASRELTRLIEFLAPPDLRNGRSYFGAYVAYTGILLLIYVVVCIPSVYAPELLRSLGLADMPTSSVPLAVSLMMVGLAPAIPILQRAEEKIRLLAHNLSGIPARLLHGCRTLQARMLHLPEPGGGLLIPEQDWERLRHYRAYGKAILMNDPDDFADDMAKILAFRAWLLKHKLCVSSRVPRPGISRNAVDLEARIGPLLLGLDVLSGFGQAGVEVGVEVGATSRESWEAYAEEADKLCADVCAMLMLQLEHKLIEIDSSGNLQTRGTDADEERRAVTILSEFLQGFDTWAQQGAIVVMLWIRATVVVVVFGFFWGLFLGNPDRMLSAGDGGVYAISAFLIYSLSIFVALSLHERQVQRDTWPNVATTDWSRWIGPAVGIFIAAAIPAVICSITYNLYFYIVDPEVGLDRVLAHFGPAVKGALFREWPGAMLGPILSLGIVASIDAWRAHGADSWTRRRQWLILFVVTTAMVLWATIVQALRVQTSGDGAQLMSLLLDESVLMAGLRAGLICLAVMLVCQRTLTYGLPAAGDEVGAKDGARALPIG
jgi:hypothetical protein